MTGILQRCASSERALAWPLRVAMAVTVALPLAVFAAKAAEGVGAGGSEAVFPARVLPRSLALCAAVAVVAAAAGTCAGLVAGRLPRRIGAAALFLFALPLSIPPAVHAYLWRNLAMSAGLLGALFVEGGSVGVNYAGAGLSLVSALWTLPALAAFAVAAGPGRRLEMEARPYLSAGAAARRILLPAVAPVAAASGCAVFLLAFADYGGPSLWQVTTYPVYVQSLYSSFFEPARAAAASLIPAAVTGACAAAVYLLARRGAARLNVERAPADGRSLWRPGGPSLAVLAALAIVLNGVPLLTAVWLVFSAPPALGSLGPVFGDLGWSAGLAAFSAAGAAVLAGCAVAAHWPRARRWTAAMTVAALAVFLLPSAALALAVKEITLWRFVPAGFGSTSAAYSFALVARHMVVPLVLVALAVERLDRQYEYMLRSSAVTPFRRLATALRPVAFSAAAAAFAVVLVLCVGEMAMGIILAAPGRPPVSVDLYNLMHYARQGDAVAVALAMMLGSAALLCAAFAVMGRLWKRSGQTVS